MLVTPQIFDEADELLAPRSAVLGGVLVMCFGFSAAVVFREWRAWAEVAVGTWLLAAPWLLHWERLSRAACAHIVVGSVVPGIAANGIGNSRAGMRPLEFSQQRGT
ncbi:SPW repeat domain-containing protein, partial [Methylobacterium oxalidis]|uniref:SPW repeat domain-containing protein n=1 Tax=Methylobacterium oxalidis TaxID=944322 RepID=UPI0014788F7E